jgi:hypothetical protein
MSPISISQNSRCRVLAIDEVGGLLLWAIAEPEFNPAPNSWIIRQSRCPTAAFRLVIYRSSRDDAPTDSGTDAYLR